MVERVFLDANVLFSASMGGESFVLLWNAAAMEQVALCTSPECLEEALRNIRLKRPELEERLQARLVCVGMVPPPVAKVDWARTLVPEDDAHVLAAAVEAGVAVLLTGNTRHFGALMARTDLPLRVLTVRAFLESLFPCERPDA